MTHQILNLKSPQTKVSALENYYMGLWLPDFSFYNTPKRDKIYQMAIKYTNWLLNIPIGCKMYQMAVKDANIFHSKVLQYMLKLKFLVENIPSGNPECVACVFPFPLPTMCIHSNKNTGRRCGRR
jgi:hypothetical protein